MQGCTVACSYVCCQPRMFVCVLPTTTVCYQPQMPHAAKPRPRNESPCRSHPNPHMHINVTPKSSYTHTTHITRTLYAHNAHYTHTTRIQHTLHAHYTHTTHIMSATKQNSPSNLSSEGQKGSVTSDIVCRRVAASRPFAFNAHATRMSVSRAVIRPLFGYISLVALGLMFAVYLDCRKG